VGINGKTREHFEGESVNRGDGVSACRCGNKFPPPARVWKREQAYHRARPHFIEVVAILQAYRRVIWHGFESEFGPVFTEVGTEGTGSKIDLEKSAEFL
jgi:hypothetical protein